MTQVEQEIIKSLNSLDKRLERIEKALYNKPMPKRTYVKVGIIQHLTGWDHKFLQKARENGLVKFKVEDGKFFYLLESIPERFIKNK